MRANNDRIEYTFQSLQTHYFTQLIQHYDISCISQAESGVLWALQIPLLLPVRFYINVSCGTGFTVLPCAKMLEEITDAFGAALMIRLINGLKTIMNQAFDKLTSVKLTTDVLPSIQRQEANIFGDTHFLSPNPPEGKEPDLITAQRVLLNAQIDKQPRILREWSFCTHYHRSGHPRPRS